MKHFVSSLLVLTMSVLSIPLYAQRQQPTLGRGVVAVNNGSNVTVTWRRLAQEPEAATYNIYVGGTLVNTTPLAKTSTTVSTTKCPAGSQITVTSVVNGVESEQSAAFTYTPVNLNGTAITNAYRHVNYASAGSPLPQDGTFSTKFCWPVDLDGDGEMDYVVNRCYNAKNQNGGEGWGDKKISGDCLEAYSSQGQHLWTIDLGINFFACSGQNDGVTVGDFDGDGKGEIIVQTAEGARFWDQGQKGFGKYLHYTGSQAGSNGSGTQQVSSDGSNPDIDGDGITNYTYYSKGKNPQWYFVVIDGMTGTQKDICAMTLPQDGDMTYTRTNKSAFMNDEYSYPSPAMGTAYLDGVHQSAVAQFQVRTQNGTHHYFTYAYGYQGGKFQELWRFRFHDHANLSEFHHIRIGDVDGDGKDEVLNGQCAIDHDGSLLWTSGISHGDRFRLSDIDPDNPGQEIFAIQQNAPDMLGMIVYNATDGKALKKWYLPAVGDVGRGECMDVDPTHRGYEIWSTMENIYDCKGNQIGTDKPYPYEGIWWDGDLGRESLITSGSGNNCPAIVAKYNAGGWQRLYEMSKNSGWQVAAENAVRPMFWGDIYGDWREEIILKQMDGGIEAGFVCFSTGTTSTVNNIYCLLQDPNYYGQITNRGYYQSPNTSFYLGYDMPRPPLPPFMQQDQDNRVYGLTLGNANIDLSQDANTANIYCMPVLGQTLTASGLTGTATLWKSQQGTLVLNGDNTSTGSTIISEGTLQLNGNISGTLELRARGVLAGSGSINNIILEGSLNSTGGRIAPTTVITFNQGLTINKPTYIQIDTDRNTYLQVNGNLSVSQPVVFDIKAKDIQPGMYKLVSYTGTCTSSVSRFSAQGLTGIPYTIVNQDGAIWLNVIKQRTAQEGVVWTGNASSKIDYLTENFSYEGESTAFVSGDGIIFDDSGKRVTVTIDDLMPVSSVTFNNDTRAYTISGNGGFSGTGGLTVNGPGKVTLNTVASDYSGKTILNGGTITVKELADAGMPSPLGAASASADNLQIGKATLIVNNSNTGTNRGITLTDSATISIASGTVALKGQIKGKGTLVKVGGGQVNITYAGTNAWGGTVLQAGTLAMGAWNTTFGSATSPMHVTGNASIVMFDSNSSSTMPNYQNVTTIDEGKTLTFKAGSRCNIRGSLLGKGTYKISFPYVRGDVYTNVSQFEGVYDVMTSNCRFIQAMDFSKATLKMESGSYAAGFKAGNGTEVSFSHKIGTLTGTGTLGTGSWQISGLLVNYRISGSTVTCDAVTVNGSATLKNVLIDLRTTSTAKIPDNAEFAVILGSGSRTVSGTVSILPERPKDGYKWDTSRLASEGIISVIEDPTGIETLEGTKDSNAVMYDLSGRKINSPQRGTIGIVNGKKIMRE